MIGKFKNIQSCNHSLLNHNIRQARTHSFIHSTIQSILLTLFRDNLMNKIVFLLFIVTFYSFITLAQEDIHIGTTPLDLRRTYQGGLFDYSDPETVNITVQVWGFVKYPGQYIIPGYSSVNNLIALAGGPSDDANLDDLRIFRINKDSSQAMIKFDYDDLLWNDELSDKIKIPVLLAGDILLVPGEPRFYFKDYFSLITSVIGTLVSITILFVTIFKD